MNRTLSGVRVYAEGNRVAVRDESGSWEPETGQVLLDFDVSALAEATQPLHPNSKESREEADPKAAADAYREVLDVDPGHIEAHVNLGRLCHEAGELGDAESLYRAAMELCPDDPVVIFNLALVLEDARRFEDACSAYQDVLELDPEFADAHYNLASLYEEELPDPAAALRHYRAYQKLRF